MRRALVLVTIAAGCVHEPELSGTEYCGARGLVFAGTTSTTMEDRSVAFVGTRPIVVVSAGEAESLSCRRPDTQQDDCEIQAAAVSRAVKEDWSATGRNWLIVAGAVAFVIPGLVLSHFFTEEMEDVGADQRPFAKAFAACMAERAAR